VAELSGGEVRLAAMNLLAGREHSRKELRDKLARRCSDEVLLESVLDGLVADRLQSDQRFAESFVRSRARRGYGPYRLRQELKQRGVDTELVGDTLAAADVDWAAQAREVQVKKFGEQPPQDLKERARRARFLYQRGFDPSEFNG
jgi:regulatory protein